MENRVTVAEYVVFNSDGSLAFSERLRVVLKGCLMDSEVEEFLDSNLEPGYESHVTYSEWFWVEDPNQ